MTLLNYIKKEKFLAVKMNIAIDVLYSFDFVNKDFSVAIANLAGVAELPYLF
tara:strand:+ start:150 stop:305 length:156 start_codon:yes stop_codon:yes gene_type:complete